MPLTEPGSGSGPGLSPDLATPLARAFGLAGPATLAGPVARGQLGQVWQLATSAGRFAVKEPFGPVDDDQAERDAAYQDRLYAAGVPMPAVVRAPDRHVIADVGGSHVRLYQWVDVLPHKRRLDPGAVGRLVAGIHRVRVPTDRPVDEWYAAPLGGAAWSELADRLGRAAAPFAADLAGLLPTVAAAERLVEPRSATQLCHLDLWADNVLRSARGGLVVLDWENAGPGYPAGELVLVLYEFGDHDPERMRLLAREYAANDGPARVTDAGDASMLICQIHHIARVGCEGWLRSTTVEGRRHHEEWVREFLDDPVTEALVNQIVDAAD